MKLLLLMTLVASVAYGSDPAPTELCVANGYRTMSAYGLMHFILDENNELLGVFASEQEIKSTVNIDSIMDEFFPINIVRYGRTGSLTTEVITRLAESESRERQSHGKDSFWKDLLTKRKEEETAQRIFDTLNQNK